MTDNEVTTIIHDLYTVPVDENQPPLGLKVPISVQSHTTTGDYIVNTGGTAGNPRIYYPSSGGTDDQNQVIYPINTGGTYTISYPDSVDVWPQVEDALGIVFIDGDEIKLKTKNGKEVVIARLDDKDDFIPIEVIAAKKKLLEGTREEE